MKQNHSYDRVIILGAVENSYFDHSRIKQKMFLSVNTRRLRMKYVQKLRSIAIYCIAKVYSGNNRIIASPPNYT